MCARARVCVHASETFPTRNNKIIRRRIIYASSIVARERERERIRGEGASLFM
jgi:hypothetical protein